MSGGKAMTMWTIDDQCETMPWDDTYHVEPSRTLFIDDTPANIEGAMYVGWQGFCFNRPGKLAAFVGDRKG